MILLYSFDLFQYVFQPNIIKFNIRIHYVHTCTKLTIIKEKLYIIMDLVEDAQNVVIYVLK